VSPEGEKPFPEEFFSVYGFPFSFRSNHFGARSSILGLYRQFRTPDSAQGAVEALLLSHGGEFPWRLGEKTFTAPDLKSALWGLEASLCETIVRSQLRLIPIHAAAIYSGDAAILLVGTSGAGKSTLSVAMTRRGFTAATDDVALVEPETLTILPIPRCFHLDHHSVQLLEEDGVQLPQSWKQLSFLTPADLHGRSLPQSQARTLIYIAGPRAECPHLNRISQSEMAARLLSETGQGTPADSRTVGVLTRIVAGASCFTLVPGPLTQTADALADLIR
jgi:hypothetical protein